MRRSQKLRCDVEPTQARQVGRNQDVRRFGEICATSLTQQHPDEVETSPQHACHLIPSHPSIQSQIITGRSHVMTAAAISTWRQPRITKPATQARGIWMGLPELGPVSRSRCHPGAAAAQLKLLSNVNCFTTWRLGRRPWRACAVPNLPTNQTLGSISPHLKAMAARTTSCQSCQGKSSNLVAPPQGSLSA